MGLKSLLLCSDEKIVRVLRLKPGTICRVNGLRLS